MSFERAFALLLALLSLFLLYLAWATRRPSATTRWGRGLTPY